MRAMMGARASLGESIQVGLWDRTSFDFNLSKRSLRQFVKLAWPVVEPKTPYQDNWHIGAICEHLQAVTDGQIQDLIINIPPRHMKSTTVSVMWPAWEWGPKRMPHTRFLFGSYDYGLAIRDSVKCRRIIQSPWYQQVWGDVFQLTGDQNAKQRYDNNVQGSRLSTSVGGAATGEGGDRIVVDDPHNIKDIEMESTLKRETVLTWWDVVMSTRINQPDSATVIIMQRSHHQDLTGHILKRGDKVELLCLPEEFESAKACVTVLGRQDPRRNEGELIWPERFSEPYITKQKGKLGSLAYAGQYQQRPTPKEGAVFQRSWWKFYDVLPNHGSLQYIQSWDMTFKDSKSSSYVVGQVWALEGDTQWYLVDEIRDRMSFTQTCASLKSLSHQYPGARLKLIEEKANGAAVMDFLKKQVSGMVPINPQGSKEARAHAVSPEAEAGNVWLPSNKTWVRDWVDEVSSFPRSYTDRTDAFSQAITEGGRRMRSYAEGLAPIVSLTQRNEFDI